MKRIFSVFIAILVLIETILILITIFFHFGIIEPVKETYFLDEDQAWADTLLKHMSLTEKIGQMCFVEIIGANKDSSVVVDSIIKSSSIGGLVFKKSELINQLFITNYVQSRAKTPLLIGSEGSIINQESFNLPIGAVIDAVIDSVFTDLYLDYFAETLKYEGVKIDFSNNLNQIDSTNPTFGFSQKNDKIIYYSSSFRKKLHKRKIISCFNYSDDLFFKKDTKKIDSICNERKALEIENFFAVKQETRATDTISHSKSIYNFDDFYKRNYNFKGLVFSCLSDSTKEKSIKSLFQSGTDAFIIRRNPKKYILFIKNLVNQGDISELQINAKVKRILMAKKWAGLDKQEFRSVEWSLSKIYGLKYKMLSWQLYEKSICLVKNQGNTIPFVKLLNNPTHILCYGNSNFPFFKQYLNYYIDASASTFKDASLIQKQLAPYRNVIITVGKPLDEHSSDTIFLKAISQIAKTKKLIVVNFGNPLNIKKLQFAQVILHTYDDHSFSQAISAQIIAGSIVPSGSLVPKYSGFPQKPAYHGIDRFEYTIPEVAGFSSPKLGLIDTLIDGAIELGAMPGCQILAAKNGKVFYYKSFGHLSYGISQPVDNLDIYDLASISKVAATTMAAMKLYENGKFKLSDSIKYYIEDTIHCTVKNHQIRDFFIHQSGLQPDMPILPYIRYRKSGIGRYDKYYSSKKDSSYTIKVAKDFYLRKDYLDSIKLSLYNLEWDTAKPYVYSDINFNIIYDILLRKIKGDYIQYLNSNFYNPLQLRSIGFLPIDRFPEQRIAPTQDDKHWRKQLLRGIPHDESAAIYGGISGNAGLFSDANDLAILFQMLINGGNYGGQKVFEKETIEYFTSVQENSNRGLGFAWNDGFFGHTGFTGCVVWANPKTQMVFVFLSNCIHPNPNNQRMKQMKIRGRVLNLILSAYKPEVLKQIEDE